MKTLEKTHDLNLSNWGPYSKKYAGISHVANSKQGIRFDLSVFPSMYRRKIDLPHCMFESNYHIMQANADLSYYSTRHELEWKDLLYTDISYSKLDGDCYIIRTNCTNNTNDTQNLALHLMASLQYPSIDAKYDEKFLYPIKYNIPKNAQLIYAINFDTFDHKIIRPTDSLIADGLRRGEVRKNGFNRGSGVLLGEFDGDCIQYTLNSTSKFKKASISIRALNTSKTTVRLDFIGALKCKVTIPVNEEITITSTELEILQNGTFTVSASGGQVLLDSFVITEKTQINEILITEPAPEYLPTSWENGRKTPINYETEQQLNQQKTIAERLPITDNTLILKYRDSDFYYGICWDFCDYDIRYILSDDLDTYLKVMAHDHFRKVLPNNNKGAFCNVFMRPIPVPPKTQFDVFSAVCCGKNKEEVAKKLSSILTNQNIMQQTAIKQALTAQICKPTINGEVFALSQNIMKATTLCNVVYPVYTKQRYIKHNTPGKWWDSLYTWDSGFVGLGFTTCDIQRAIDCLNAYVTEPNDEENAFIHHGTPLPVQFYLFQEIFNLTHDTKLADYFYPRLRQYYLFISGQKGSSDTARLNSGMLATWSYFYNSGGWDDYPPQVQVHNSKQQKYISPVSTTTHAIRCAKILWQIADILPQFSEDITGYKKDIKKLTAAIQTYTWDEKSGYFSYLCHDENLNPTEIMRHKSGENFNRGLDGTSPMIAGILTKKQAKTISENLMNPQRHFTKIGLSTVDISAPYYKTDGYWNGAVWMPHQWFYFKALLDYGYADESYKIAKTALDTWQNEVAQSYNCFEHFIIASGRGAGWHHFSGLSTPVLLWFQTYFNIGTITCGYNGLITAKTFDEHNLILNCEIKYLENKEKTTIIIVMPPENKYAVTVNSSDTTFSERFSGVIEITLNVDSLQTLEICCKKAL